MLARSWLTLTVLARLKMENSLLTLGYHYLVSNILTLIGPSSAFGEVAVDSEDHEVEGDHEVGCGNP